MNTMKDKPFDYPKHMKTHGPNAGKIQRGPQTRQARREAAKERITIRIDVDVLAQFKAMVLP